MNDLKSLQDYVKKNALIGPVTENSADMVFFNVRAESGTDAAELRKLVMGSVDGAHCTLNLFDGYEHSYLEVGAWIGDQGLALSLMGLGSVLGLWKLLTPKTVLGKDISLDLEQQMAGMGFIAIQATK